MIRNMLELSTAHIPGNGPRFARWRHFYRYGSYYASEGGGNLVLERPRTPFRIEEHDYGYIVFVSAVWSMSNRPPGYTITDEDLREALEGVAGWLVPIYTHAIKHGCGIINFDADGPIVEEFKTYE